MTNINMRFICLIFFMVITGFCFAGKPTHAPEKIRTDTSMVAIRSFDAQTLKNFNHQPEFNYHEEAIDNSLWLRFWKWFWHLFKFDDKAARLSPFWLYFYKGLKYLLILLGISALVLLVLKLAGININIFRKKAAAIPYSEFFENIHEIDFDSEIDNAVNQQNYRFAVRLLYLKSLKKLSDASWIEWQIDKTNSKYISEIVNERQRSVFRQLTKQFEYVWYGHFAIDKQIYQQIDGLFNEFNKGVA